MIKISFFINNMNMKTIYGNQLKIGVNDIMMLWTDIPPVPNIICWWRKMNTEVMTKRIIGTFTTSTSTASNSATSNSASASASTATKTKNWRLIAGKEPAHNHKELHTLDCCS